MRLVLIALVLGCTIGLSAAALAQEPYMPPATVDVQPPPLVSNTTGFFLRAGVNGVGLALEDADAEGGGGLGLKLGYGFSRLFTLYAGFDMASMESGAYSYGTFDLGGRFNFRSGRHALVPYVDAALSGQAVVVEFDRDNVTLSGAGLTVGGGITYFVSPVFALDGGLAFTGGSFSQGSYRGNTEKIDVSTTSARVALGVTWYPKR